MGTNASYVSDSLRARIFFGSRVARHRLVFAVAGLFFLADIAQTELIGTSICGCQPATYTFTLDFGLTCRDGNVAGPGINDTACLTEIRGQKEVPPQDLVPVTVQNIQIFELDQNKKPFSQSVRVGTFQNGSNFTYTSVISTMTSDLNAISLPRGLQLVITGINSKEEPVVQTYAISYTNDCGVFPVLKVGQTAGWTIFVSALAPTAFTLARHLTFPSLTFIYRATWEIRPPRSVRWLLQWHLPQVPAHPTSPQVPAHPPLPQVTPPQLPQEPVRPTLPQVSVHPTLPRASRRWPPTRALQPEHQ